MQYHNSPGLRIFKLGKKRFFFPVIRTKKTCYHLYLFNYNTPQSCDNANPEHVKLPTSKGKMAYQITVILDGRKMQITSSRHPFSYQYVNSANSFAEIDPSERMALENHF